MTEREIRSRKVDFERINLAALARAEEVARAFAPDGRREGGEWSARNPMRGDHRQGSFKLNLHSGKWADFASGDRGGDLVSWVAFLTGKSQREAAIALGEALGLGTAIYV